MYKIGNDWQGKCLLIYGIHQESDLRTTGLISEPLLACGGDDQKVYLMVEQESKVRHTLLGLHLKLRST